MKRSNLIRTNHLLRQTAARLDFHLLLVWLFILPAVTPLFQPTLSRSADGLLHLYRLIALGYAFAQGAIFPRWLPDLAFGYGMPLFVFYAPLAYYLTVGLLLIGLPAVTAVNISFGLALFTAGSGVYLLLKEWGGPKAGLVAGVAYVYAPYHLVTVLSRGSLPAIWASALFPFVFWAFTRLIRTNRPVYLGLSGLLSGLALLAHNITSLIFMPVLLAYLLLYWLLTTPPKNSGGLGGSLARLLPIGLALAMGISLATFFLLPAMVEQRFVHIERVITPPDFDYHSNFVDLAGLFTFPPPANTGLLNPNFPVSLGLVQVGLALAAWLVLAGSRAGRNWIGSIGVTRIRFGVFLFASLGLGATIFIMLPLSLRVWDTLPLIAFIQQPTRLLGLAAFLLAILAGLGVAMLPDRWSLPVTITGLGLLILSGMPLLYPRYYDPLPAPPSLRGMMAYERASGTIGTTSFGEYLPIWVKQTPRESPLEPMYGAGNGIERLDPAYLAPGSSLEAARYGFNRVELKLTTPEPSQAIFHTFYFPGWTAKLDGETVPTGPVTERGLVGVVVPAGTHQLELYFSETPVRLAANWLSGLALLVILYLIYRGTRVSQPLRPEETGRSSLGQVAEPSGFSPAQLALLAGLALLMLGIKILYLDRYDNPIKHVFAESGVTGAAVTRQVNFGDQLNLLGYDLSASTAAPGEALELTLYWQAREPLSTNYSVLVQLVDDQQHLYAAQDSLHPGNLPTSRWEPWGFVIDPHSMQVPPGTPPGDYLLVAGLYNPVTWARLPVVAGGDPEWSDVLAIPISITGAEHVPTLAELAPDWPAPEQDLNGLPIQLLGATPERDTIRPNDFLRIALFWEALSTPALDYEISLRLVTGDGTVVLTASSQPSYNRYPTSGWQAGERVRDNQALWIPPDLPAGSYQIQLQILDETDQPTSNWLELGQLELEQPTP